MWTATAVCVVCVSLLSTSVVGDCLGVPCPNQDDCSAMEGSFCDDTSKYCVCRGGQVPNSDLSKCLLVADNYGAECEDNSQCTARLGPGGVCDATCSCNQGFHYLHGRCWRSVGLNGSCSKTEQCFENYNYESLSCRAGHCECSAGFYLRGHTHCRREGTGTGEECTFDMDCRCEGHNGTCVGNQCQCKEPSLDQTLIPEDNVKAASLQPRRLLRRDALTCASDSDCEKLGPHAECNTGHSCWCQHGSYFNTSTNTCVPELGESCSQSEDCSHIRFSTCRVQGEGTGYCSCVVQYTPSTDNRQCAKLRKFGYNCQSPETCLDFGPLAVCDDVTRQCGCDSTSHFEEDQNMCWITRGVNENCTSSSDCATVSGDVDSVVCEEATGTCRCVPGYHEASGDCRRSAMAPGELCLEDLDCMFDHSRCVDGVCGCGLGYFQNGTDGELSCVGGIGSPCDATEDCVVVKSVCANETCSCNPRYSPHLVASADSSACLKVSTDYGGACLESVQCQTAFGSSSDCVDGICVCHERFHFRDHFCWPITMLGDRCNRTSECYLEADIQRSECRKGVCECLYDYERSDVLCVSGGNMLGSVLATLISAMWICSFVK